MRVLPKSVNFSANLKSGITVGAPPPAFDLMDENPHVWFDPSDIGNVAHVDNYVTQLSDDSGNAKHAIMTIGSLQPQTGVDTINGLNVLTFNNDALTIYNPSLGLVDVFLVFNTTDTDYTHFADGSNEFTAVGGSGNSGTSIDKLVGTPSYYKNGVPQNFTTRDDVYSAFNNQDVVLLMRNIDFSAWVNINIFNYPHQDEFDTNGKMGELIIIPAGKSNASINNIGGYLERWGISWTDL